MRINPSITANYFLQRGKDGDIPITLMKLLKLVFIAHGWVLAVLDDEFGVMDGEPVQAWKHGPVVPSLYYEFKRWHEMPIRDCWSEMTLSELDTGFIAQPIFLETSEIKNDVRLREILGFVWEAYKDFSAWGLSAVTHKEGTPWQQVYKEGARGLVIGNDIIKSFYKNYLKQMASDDE